VVVRSVRQDSSSSSRIRSIAEYRTGVESSRVSELAATEMARKELDGSKKTLCVI
jgi:hypothetical protein